MAITGVRDGATYQPGHVPVAACTASDGLSGLAGPCATRVTGGPRRTGTFFVTAVATDRAGNSATVTAKYQVGCSREDGEHDRRGARVTRRSSEARGQHRDEWEEHDRRDTRHRGQFSPAAHGAAN